MSTEDARTLLLLRHAQTEDFAPGRSDAQRVLTGHGHQQAREVGEELRRRDLPIERVLCSPSERTRQTLAELRLPDDVRVDLVEAIYEAGSDTLRQLVSELGADGSDPRSVLLIGHGPGVPQLAHDLAGSDSAPQALGVLERGFPTATLAALRLRSGWSDLAEPESAQLEWISLH